MESLPLGNSFGWDTSTPFAGAFEVAGTKATRKDGGGRYQITGQHALPNTPTTTRFRIHYGGGYGIITEGWWVGVGW